MADGVTMIDYKKAYETLKRKAYEQDKPAHVRIAGIQIFIEALEGKE